MNPTKIPKNVTVWEGGRRHREEIPGRLADNIAKIEERESSKTRETSKKYGTFSGAITKAQSILDKQAEKSENKSDKTESVKPELKLENNAPKAPEKK